MKSQKDELKQHLKNPNDKLIAVDLDGTLCEGEFWGDGVPKPKQQMIDFVNSLYTKGAHIIIYTARQPKHFQVTLGWLITHGVMFHGIAMQQKCGADLYIEDKALNIDDLEV